MQLAEAEGNPGLAYCTAPLHSHPVSRVGSDLWGSGGKRVGLLPSPVEATQRGWKAARCSASLSGQGEQRPSERTECTQGLLPCSFGGFPRKQRLPGKALSESPNCSQKWKDEAKV